VVVAAVEAVVEEEVVVDEIEGVDLTEEDQYGWISKANQYLFIVSFCI
jgi:hypothetical protein